MRSVVTLTLIAALAPLAGCGDDAPSDADSPRSTETPATVPPTEQPTAPEATTSAPDLGDATVVPLRAADICRLVPKESVTAVIGTEVTAADPEDSLNPQCLYTYGGDSSTLSTLTIATQRPEDVGDRTLQDAFDYVVELNQDLGQPSELERVDVAAGDRTVRLSGPALTLEVMAVADHLVAIVATPDLDPGAVDSLAVVVGEALR